jgi:hypothetical protein
LKVKVLAAALQLLVPRFLHPNKHMKAIVVGSAGSPKAVGMYRVKNPPEGMALIVNTLNL